MSRYVLQKLLSLFPVLIGISLIAFLLGVISPGDPVEIALNQSGMGSATQEQIDTIRDRLGLNNPLPTQYLRWAGSVLRGNLGNSYYNNRSVSHELARRLPVTLRLTGYCIVIASFFGVLLGVTAAAYRDRLPDRIIKTFTNTVLSLPAFWMALLMILLFSERLGWLPTSGVGGFKYMLMPALVLSGATTAGLARLVRSTMLAEFGKQYFLAANARGLGRIALFLCTALPNAILPAVTLLGNYFGGILGGSVVVETIFALPGIGSYAIESIGYRDYPALQGYVLFTGFLFVSITLLVDLLCMALNPKIRLGGTAR